MTNAPIDSDLPTGDAYNAAPTISVNAAKVLDTTRRAWETSAACAPVQSERAAQQAASKKRVNARRSQWGNLVAALNYWSPKPL